MATYAYGGKEFTVPSLSDDGVTFTPSSRKIDFRDSPIFRDVGSIWDESRFSTQRPPVDLGEVPSGWNQRAPVPRILDMPIKMSGSMEFRLPREIAHLAPLVKMASEVEKGINPFCEDYFAYITLDQGEVLPGKMQRNEGL